jgi:hypothetical protein
LTHNPYSAPDAPVKDRVAAEFSWRTVAMGVLVGFGTCYVLWVPLYLVAQHWYVSRLFDEELAYDAVFNSLVFLFGTLVAQFAGMMAGSYALTRMRPPRLHLHVLIAALIATAIEASSFLDAFPNPFPRWWQYAIAMLVLPAYVCGALIFSRHGLR